MTCCVPFFGAGKRGPPSNNSVSHHGIPSDSLERATWLQTNNRDELCTKLDSIVSFELFSFTINRRRQRHSEPHRARFDFNSLHICNMERFFRTDKSYHRLRLSSTKQLAFWVKKRANVFLLLGIAGPHSRRHLCISF